MVFKGVVKVRRDGIKKEARVRGQIAKRKYKYSRYLTLAALFCGLSVTRLDLSGFNQWLAKFKAITGKNEAFCWWKLQLPWFYHMQEVDFCTTDNWIVLAIPSLGVDEPLSKSGFVFHSF